MFKWQPLGVRPILFDNFHHIKPQDDIENLFDI